MNRQGAKIAKEDKDMKDQMTSWWVFPAIFYIIHFFAVLAFASGNAPMNGPYADAGSMIWIAWMLIDFPFGFIAVGIADTLSTNTMGVLAVALIGGMQWVIWGLYLTAIIRKFQKKKIQA